MDVGNVLRMRGDSRVHYCLRVRLVDDLKLAYTVMSTGVMVMCLPILVDLSVQFISYKSVVVFVKEMVAYGISHLIIY